MQTIVLLLGMQGSGKGTVARSLGRELAATPIGAGDLLRRHVVEEGEWADEIEARLKLGQGVDRRISYGLLESELERLRDESLLVLDGFPRLADQLPLLLGILGRDPDLAIHLDIIRPIAAARLMQREVCASCGHPFGPEVPPLSSGTCNDCGGALVRRTDDYPVAIGRRNDAWIAESPEILAFFERAGSLERIDASRPPDLVQGEALALVTRCRN